jgi:hypothetical protein
MSLTGSGSSSEPSKGKTIKAAMMAACNPSDTGRVTILPRLSPGDIVSSILGQWSICYPFQP